MNPSKPQRACAPIASEVIDADSNVRTRPYGYSRFADLAALVGFRRMLAHPRWLPFAVWMLVPCAVLPTRHVRVWLAPQGILALLVNHLSFTVW